MLAVSETGGILASYFKAGAAAWVLVGLLFAVRLFSAGYVYAIFRDVYSGKMDLVINEHRFGRSRIVCRVSLYDIKEIVEYDSSRKMPRGKRQKLKKQKRVSPDRKKNGERRYYNYCTDVLPSKYCILRVSGSESAYIKFSPDETMINVIKNVKIK